MSYPIVTVVAMTTRQLQLGADGEELAARWYVNAGYRIVDRNWRCRNGEVDLILERPGELIFCEVKTRSSQRYGHPVEAVTPLKARKVRQLAAVWMAHHPGGGRTVRFDVAGVIGGEVIVAQSAF